MKSDFLCYKDKFLLLPSLLCFTLPLASGNLVSGIFSTLIVVFEGQIAPYGIMMQVNELPATSSISEPPVIYAFHPSAVEVNEITQRSVPSGTTPKSFPPPVRQSNTEDPREFYKRAQDAQRRLRQLESDKAAEEKELEEYQNDESVFLRATDEHRDRLISDSEIIDYDQLIIEIVS